MKSLLFEPRPALKATEARLEAIYNAAKRGLKGDSLAWAAGMRPDEYRRLCENDPLAEYAALQGRADDEMEMAELLRAAAAAGDWKAANTVLQQDHGKVVRQQVDVTETRISILAALGPREERLTIDEASERANTPRLLTNQPGETVDGYEDVNAGTAQRADALRR